MSTRSWLNRQRRRLVRLLDPDAPLASEERALDRLVARLSRVEAQLARLLEAQRDRYEFDRKSHRWVTRMLRSMVTYQRLKDWPELDAAHQLLAEQVKLESQNEEDGVIFGILRRIGAYRGTFVELGSGMSGGNSAGLARHLGWGGLMVEADPRKAARAAARFAGCDGVRVVCATVTSSNVNQLLRENGIEGEIEYFSLDIDSYDYWVWKAVEVVSPKVVTLEYNATFGPTARVAVREDALDEEAHPYCWGASLAAMEALSREKGYRLIYCESVGVNAFFVRDDLWPEAPALAVERAYRPLGKLSEFGAIVDRDLECPSRHLERCAKYLVEV